MLFASWEVCIVKICIVKNCDQGLENAARGRRPRTAFLSPLGKNKFLARLEKNKYMY